MVASFVYKITFAKFHMYIRLAYEICCLKTIINNLMQNFKKSEIRNSIYC